MKSSKLKRIRKVITLDTQDSPNNSDEFNLNQKLNKDLPNDVIVNAIDIKKKEEERERNDCSILDDLEKEPECDEERENITQMIDTVLVTDSWEEDHEQVNPRFVTICLEIITPMYCKSKSAWNLRKEHGNIYGGDLV